MNIDRILGLCFVGFVLVLAVTGVTTGIWELFVFVLVLLVWGLTGLKNLPIGWKGQLLCFGQRQPYFVSEGLHWAPPPFDFKTADCRDRIFRLDNARIFTVDGAEVEIREIAIVWKIFELKLFFELDSKELDQLLDDIVDKNVKSKIKDNKVRDVLSMDLGTEQVSTEKDLKRWGIEVIRVIVPEAPEPTDPKVKAAIQLEVAEKFERVGQTVEGEFIPFLVGLFMKPVSEGGAGMNHEEAVAEARLTTKQAAPETLQRIKVDGDAASAIVASILGKKEGQ